MLEESHHDHGVVQDVADQNFGTLSKKLDTVFYFSKMKCIMWFLASVNMNSGYKSILVVMALQF